METGTLRTQTYVPLQKQRMLLLKYLHTFKEYSRSGTSQPASAFGKVTACSIPLTPPTHAFASPRAQSRPFTASGTQASPLLITLAGARLLWLIRCSIIRLAFISYLELHSAVTLSKAAVRSADRLVAGCSNLGTCCNVFPCNCAREDLDRSDWLVVWHLVCGNGQLLVDREGLR